MAKEEKIKSGKPHFDKAVEDRLARTGEEPMRLKPSGDAEHDALTDQVHGLDALAPERNEVFAEANAEALDDEAAAAEKHSD